MVKTKHHHHHHEHHEVKKEELAIVEDAENDLENPPPPAPSTTMATERTPEMDTLEVSQDDTTSFFTSTAEEDSTTSTANVATIRQVFSFGSGPKKNFGILIGCLSAMVAGAVGPFMIFYFASVFSDLVADPTTDEFLDNVKELAYIFLVLG